MGGYLLSDQILDDGCGLERPPVVDVPVPVEVRDQRLLLLDVVALDVKGSGNPLVISEGRSGFELDAAQGFHLEEAGTAARPATGCEADTLALDYQLLPSSTGTIEVESDEDWTLPLACAGLAIAGRPAPNQSCLGSRLLKYTLSVPCEPPCVLRFDFTPSGTSAAHVPPQPTMECVCN